MTTKKVKNLVNTKRPVNAIREFMRKNGRKGGNARARKYDHEKLSAWAKKGGRPKKAI